MKKRFSKIHCNYCRGFFSQPNNLEGKIKVAKHIWKKHLKSQDHCPVFLCREVAYLSAHIHLGHNLCLFCLREMCDKRCEQLILKAKNEDQSCHFSQ